MAHINITNAGVGGTQGGPALTQNNNQGHACAVNNTDAAVYFQLQDADDTGTVSPRYKVDANKYLIVPFPGTAAHNIINVSTAHLTGAQTGEFLYVFQVDSPTDFDTANSEYYANGR